MTPYCAGGASSWSSPTKGNDTRRFGHRSFRADKSEAFPFHFSTTALRVFKSYPLSAQKLCFDHAKRLLSAADRAAFGKSKQPFQRTTEVHSADNDSTFSVQQQCFKQATTVLSAGNGGALSRQKNSGGCGRLPLDSGSAGSHDDTQGFPVGVEAGGFTSP